MSGWDGQPLSDEEQEAWDEFVRQVREDAAQKIAQSSYVLSLMPREEVDVKYAVELGLSIMFDKPIVVVAHPDALIPGHLLRVADHIVRADIDTDEGRSQVAFVMQTLREPYGEEMP